MTDGGRGADIEVLLMQLLLMHHGQLDALTARSHGERPACHISAGTLACRVSVFFCATRTRFLRSSPYRRDICSAPRPHYS